MSQDHPPRPKLSLGAAASETGRLLPGVWSGARYALGLWAGIGVAGVFLAGGVAGAVMAGLGAVAALVAIGAVLRVGVADDLVGARALGLGPGGLQVGLPEMRLLGAFALCLLFWAIVASLVGLTVLALFGGAELDVAAIRARDWGAVGPAWRVAVVAVVGIGAILVPLMLAARLSLAGPATVAQGRMVSLPAMAISRANVLPLMAGIILYALPGLILIGAFAGLGGRVAGIVSAIAVPWVLVPMVLTFLGVVYRRVRIEQDAT